MQGESFDQLLDRILDTLEFEQKSSYEIEKATQLAEETIDSCKDELDDLFG